MSANGFYRFAATDTATEAFRPRAISWVMAGGLLSAVVGPNLVKVTAESMVVPFLGTYLAAMALNAVGVFLFALLRIPRAPARAAGAPPGRSWGALLRKPRIGVAVICATVCYALMNLVMTSSPLAVIGCGFSQSNVADIMTSHVLAMYVPAFFTGRLIARFGTERIMGLGLCILACAGAVAISGVALTNFFGTMVLLGLGWNFGFIGATTMLASSYEPEERSRVQGMNDFLVFAGVTFASLSSGGLMNCSGGSPQEGWTMVNLAMLPFLVLAGGALIWLALQPREMQARAGDRAATPPLPQAGRSTDPS
jgi:predicted MFS family arabinose efflux permease